MQTIAEVRAPPIPLAARVASALGSLTVACASPTAASACHAALGPLNRLIAPPTSDNVAAASVAWAIFTIQAKAERGVVTFGNAFKDVVISPDGTSGSAVVGNGAGSLEASTTHGNIAFKSIN